MNYKTKLFAVILIVLLALCGTLVFAEEEPTQEITEAPAPTVEETTARPVETTEAPALETDSPATKAESNNAGNSDKKASTTSSVNSTKSNGSAKATEPDYSFVERTMPVSPTHIVTDANGNTTPVTNVSATESENGSGFWLKYVLPCALILIAIGAIFYVNLILYNKKHNANKIERNLYDPKKGSKKDRIKRNKK